MSHHEKRKRERQDNLQPEPENQAAANTTAPATGTDEGPTQSVAGQDHDTGAGTGGATESQGRPGNHEGMHLGNQPNS